MRMEGPMRIVDIRETAIPLKSDLANSSFDFSEMTTSVVAVITDVMRDGKPVAGFAFNSTGRYACGAQMRARFIPRILEGRAEVAAQRGRRQSRSGKNPRRDDAQREVRRPQRALGRHRHHRGRGVGRGRQDRGQAAASRAGRALQRRQGADKVFCYVGGGWYAPGKTTKDLQDEMRRHLDSGYTMVKMKVGGMPLAEDMRRVEAVKSVVGNRGELAVDANCKFEPRRGARLRQGDVALQAALVRGAVRPARLRAAGGDVRRL